jgi:hypothetical protein
VDSSTLLRRTPAGDSEVAAPANGLSVTQRRILALLEHPVRLGDLHVGRSLDAQRLAHEAARLRKAGLIACETTRDTTGITAANAATIHPPGRPLARPLPLAVVFLAASLVVWAGWQYNSAPTAPSESRRHAGAAPAPGAPNPQGADVPREPPVIATRVLKGDVADRNRDAAKDRAPVRTPVPSPSANTATRDDSRAHDKGTASELPGTASELPPDP